jgi:transposase
MLRDNLSQIWLQIQENLFPWLAEEIGELNEKQQQLISILELLQVESYFYYGPSGVGRPQDDRVALARAFVLKAVYNMPTTRMLIDRLHTDIKLRRICGWERKQDIPEEWTFSRSFQEFSESRLAERVHSSLIKNSYEEELVGHISRDSTAIEAREKVVKKVTVVEDKPTRKVGRPKKGEEVKKEPTRLEKQAGGMSVSEMLKDLPKACDVGRKKNSKGVTTQWIGYKLHIDAADGGIPVNCLLTSASMHDSQAAIPLAEITNRRVKSLYDLMDSAYDSPQIHEHSKHLGHIPIIDKNPRRDTDLKEQIKQENKAQRKANYKPAKETRYHERSTVERVNGRLKDEFGGRMVRVKGNQKVMCHLMFGILALTADQLLKMVT